VSAPAPPIPDLHFHAEPIQIGQQIMVRVQMADNFGMTFQIVVAPQIADGFGQLLKNAAAASKTMLVKPPSLVHEA